MKYLENWWTRFLAGLVAGGIYMALFDKAMSRQGIVVFFLVFGTYFLLSIMYGLSRHNQSKIKKYNPEIIDEV